MIFQLELHLTKGVYIMPAILTSVLVMRSPFTHHQNACIVVQRVSDS